ncbi:MAG: hypothetical protein HY204_12430 [Nitrospirae bacterium]|nr:hypothetical protein [Nitrospirota bacterium]
MPIGLADVVKYRRGINKALESRDFGSADAVENEAKKNVNRLIEKKGGVVTAKGKVTGGAAFGIEVAVLYWAIKWNLSKRAQSGGG